MYMWWRGWVRGGMYCIHMWWCECLCVYVEHVSACVYVCSVLYVYVYICDVCYICSIYMHICASMSAVCIHAMCICVCCIAVCMCAICACVCYVCVLCVCVYIEGMIVSRYGLAGLPSQMQVLNLSSSTAGAASQSQFSVLQLDGSNPLPDCNLTPALI